MFSGRLVELDYFLPANISIKRRGGTPINIWSFHWKHETQAAYTQKEDEKKSCLTGTSCISLSLSSLSHASHDSPANNCRAN
jgi:hypothetical protein